jgi:hypothetical protein
MKVRTIVGVGALVAMAVTGNAQTSDVRVQVGDVKDSRTTGKFFADLEIELKLMGDDLEGTKGLRCTVTKAVDDTGRNLIKEKEDRESKFSDVNDNSPNQAEVTVELKNPTRKAVTVKELSGEIDLYRPGKDPASIIVVTNIVGRPKIVVSQPSLTAAQIQMTILSKKQYDADLQAEAKAAEAKKAAGKQGDDIGKAMAEGMGKAFAGMFGGGGMGGENSVIIRLKDPQSKLVKIEFLDASGKKVDGDGMWSSGDIRCYDFSQQLPKGAYLQISVATPKSLVKVPLMIKEIALP